MKTIITSIFICLLAFSNAQALETKPFIERSDVKVFIKKVVSKHKFDPKWVTDILADVKLQPKVIASISKPAEAMPWHKYRKIFLSDKRAAEGAEFWRKHDAVLKRAEKIYGVPANVIVAIIGVESRYGQRMGTYRVLDSLATLGFDYPKRGTFFKKELEQFLILLHEENLNQNDLLGSYAGAMGQPQFMPSSFRAYAVDFSKTGKKDLQNDDDDVIGSIANYFAKHGWKKGALVATPATVTGSKYKKVTSKNYKPKYSVAKLKTLGIKSKKKISNSNKAALVKLQAVEKSEFWLSFNNFYVITRYNHSPLYAMAVYQLSESINDKHKTDRI